MNKKKNQSRRRFIETLALTGATASLALIPGSIKAEFNAKGLAMNEYVDENATEAAENWLKGLEGKKFPVVYDMHEHKDFWAGIWSNIYFMSNPDVANLGVAIVMRHGGFPFALNDRMWTKYKLGEFFKIVDKNTGAPSVRNMYWEPTEKDYPLPGLAGTKALIQKGVAICVCSMALKVYSGFIAQARGMAADEVFNDFVSNILPGIQAAPSGVWALGRFQQPPLSYGYINAG